MSVSLQSSPGTAVFTSTDHPNRVLDVAQEKRRVSDIIQDLKIPGLSQLLRGLNAAPNPFESIMEVGETPKNDQDEAPVSIEKMTQSTSKIESSITNRPQRKGSMEIQEDNFPRLWRKSHSFYSPPNPKARTTKRESVELPKVPQKPVLKRQRTQSDDQRTQKVRIARIRSALKIEDRREAVPDASGNPNGPVIEQIVINVKECELCPKEGSEHSHEDLEEVSPEKPSPAVSNNSQKSGKTQRSHRSSRSHRSQDEKLCRICKDEREDEELTAPCFCSGSIKWVHSTCLKSWILARPDNSMSSRCEICKCPLFVKRRWTYDPWNLIYQCDTPDDKACPFYFIMSLLVIAMMTFGVVNLLDKNQGTAGEILLICCLVGCILFFAFCTMMTFVFVRLFAESWDFVAPKTGIRLSKLKNAQKEWTDILRHHFGWSCALCNMYDTPALEDDGLSEDDDDINKMEEDFDDDGSFDSDESGRGNDIAIDIPLPPIPEAITPQLPEQGQPQLDTSVINNLDNSVAPLQQA